MKKNNKMNKAITIIVAFLLLPLTTLMAQEIEMADTFRAEGKIYVVLAVIFILLIGIFVFLFWLESKIKKLEKKLK